MNKYTVNIVRIKKILISLLLAVLLTSFIMPNYVQADTGGKLAKPIFQFVNWIGEIIIDYLQEICVGEEKSDKVGVKYSPGVIFSGDVLMFDINFIDPNARKIDVTKLEETSLYHTESSTSLTSSDIKDRFKNWVLANLSTQTPDSPEGNSSTEANTADYEARKEEYKKVTSEAIKEINKLRTDGVHNADYSVSTDFTFEGVTYRIYHYNEMPSPNRCQLIDLKDGKENKVIYETTGTLEYLVETATEEILKQETGTNTAEGTETTTTTTEKTEDEIALETYLEDDDFWYYTSGDEYILKISGKEYKVISCEIGDNYHIMILGDKTTSTTTIESTAKKLQPTVAGWYKALRRVSLVGLLPILVYIGIRIIISSTADDKAKYKKMLSGWLEAFCLVFILHYIMGFILDISNQLNNILDLKVVNSSGQDVIMTNLKRKLGNGNNFLDLAGETVIWLVLVIYTLVFTVQYLKRVIYMVFLTMMAPLIALTYPLDKIKDGKAQAFSMWLREYIFNALLQPVHLLLYYMVVGGAMQAYAEGNPLYAVVAIGFLVPAEKFFRKMFGMESQTPVGEIGAVTGGAMLMSALKKLKIKPPKEEGEKQSKVRTVGKGVEGAGKGVEGAGKGVEGAGKGVEAGGKGVEAAGKGVETGGKGIEGVGKGIKAGSSIPYVGAVFAAVGTGVEVGGKGVQLAGKGIKTTGKGMQKAGKGMQKAGKEMKKAGKKIKENGKKIKEKGEKNKKSLSTKQNQSSKGKTTQKRGQRFTRALNKVGNKYIYGEEAKKKNSRRARKTITGVVGGVPGAIALGTIGLAAGVATGDAEKAFQYAAGGAAVGYAGGRNLADKGVAGIKGVGRTFKEGYKGTEAYNNSKFDKQFFASDEYRMIKEDSQIAANGIDTKSAVQGYLSQGVTDGTQMRKLLQKNITPDVYEKWADKSMKDPDKIRQLEKAQIDPDEYDDYVKTAKIRDIDKICDLKENGISAETYDAFNQIGISNISTMKKYENNIETAMQMRTMAKQLKNSDLSEIDNETGVPLVVKNLAPGASGKEIKNIWEDIQNFM